VLKSPWLHLKDLQFSKMDVKPIVDILIGPDCANLHYSMQRN